jgi:hypothetical protein
MDKTYHVVIRASGIVSIPALFVAGVLFLYGKAPEAKIAVGVSMGATGTALIASKMN